jgi:type VI secretion system Hcp family effector
MKNKLSIGAMVSLVLLIVVGMLISPNVSDPAVASNELSESPRYTKVLASDEIPPPMPRAAFVKYEGIDGESIDADHENWIDVLSVEWGAHEPEAGASGQSRRRGSAIVEDMMIAFEYEKAAPKLEEKCLKGAIIPLLEIELTGIRGNNRQTYLKYELKNVRISSFHVSGVTQSGPPMVVIGNNFEEIKVTYTEYDDDGTNQGNVEYSYSVDKGE